MVSRTEIALRWVAICCAIFLLFGLVSDRTTWVGGGGWTTDSAGYDWAAFCSGIVALAALAFAFRDRARRDVSFFSAAVAIAAFGLTVYVSGSYWLALSGGEALLSGIEAMPERYRVYPAAGPPFFAAAALVGAVATLAIVIGWVRTPRGVYVGGDSMLEPWRRLP